jgi:uncharacterized Zn finger protein (UPF0148 family)
MSKKVPCPGSGQKADGPDEQDGSVFCSVCGRSFLRMVKTTTADGKIQFSVSDHDRIVVKVHRPKSVSSPSRNSTRRR